ncbi:TetR/AcrR family transcriptional regulator [Curtobacterium sp. RRHDQ10]|uniref:TetR/AcrR family transcriptional regulator n=1 Tax=Curtobacterium phyllosphaerae TaxID=3413379 RepID=UPI003BEF7C2D
MDAPDAIASAPATEDHVRARVDIIDAAIDVFSRQSYRRTTVKDIADELGVTIDVVQQHFPSWQGLILSTVNAWQNQRTGGLAYIARDEGILIYMRRLVEDTVAEPMLPRMLLSVLAEAADPTHPTSAYLQTRYEAYHQIIITGIEHDIAVGRLPLDLDPVRAAETIVALWEGFRMQALLRPRMDLLQAFDHALGMLVREWGVE